MKTQKQIFLELVDETFSYYYTPDGKEIPGRRSVNAEETICLYKGPQGERCAASRLLPDGDWQEDMCCVNSPKNRTLSRKALETRGLRFESEEFAAVAMRKLQVIHDCPTVSLGARDQAKAWAEAMWPNG